MDDASQVTALAAEPTNGAASSGLYSGNASTLEVLDKLWDQPATNDTTVSPPEPSLTAPAAVAPPTPDNAAPPAGVAPEPWLETAPPEIKTLMAHANLTKETKDFIKKSYEELSGYREGGTVADAKAFREFFPEGIESARQMQEIALKAETTNQKYDSGDPQAQAEVLGELADSVPDAFLTSVQVGLDLTRQKMPAEYNQLRGILAEEHITEAEKNFIPFMDHLAQMASQGQTEQLSKLALELGTWWGSAKEKLGFGKADKAPAQLNPVQERLNAEQQKFTTERAQFAISTMEYKHSETVKPILQAEIAKEAKARGLNLSTGTLTKLASQARAELDAQVKADRAYNAYLDRVYFKGNRNNPASWDITPATMDKVMQTLAQRAQKSAGALASKLVSAWIAEFKESQTAAPPPADAAAAGVRGAPGGAPPKKGNWKEDPSVSVLDALNQITA